MQNTDTFMNISELKDKFVGKKIYDIYKDGIYYSFEAREIIDVVESPLPNKVTFVHTDGFTTIEPIVDKVEKYFCPHYLFSSLDLHSLLNEFKKYVNDIDSRMSPLKPFLPNIVYSDSAVEWKNSRHAFLNRLEMCVNKIISEDQVDLI